MIVPAYNRINAETETIMNQRCLSEDIIVSGHQKVDNFIAYRPLLLCQWGKVYKWNKKKKFTNVLLYNCRLKVPKWFHQADTVGVLSIYYQCENVGFISSPVYNYYITPQSTYGTYRPKRIQNDVLMFLIYNDFLEKYEPVSKINQEYCFAIYLSLLYENISSILNAQTVSTEQKLSDIYDIMCAAETKEMLLRKFNPIFQNLEKRQDLLKTIHEYLKSLPSVDQNGACTNKIVDELNKYGNYSIYQED